LLAAAESVQLTQDFRVAAKQPGHQDDEQADDYAFENYEGLHQRGEGLDGRFFTT
jgi:hypothetical protein